MSVKFLRYDESQKINDDASVKVTVMNHIIEVVHIFNESNILEDYRKINQHHYAVVGSDTIIKKHKYVDETTGEDVLLVTDESTGELIELLEYKQHNNRSQNIAGLKRTMKKIRDLINNNFMGASNELMITLTYKLHENGAPMNDVKKASKNFDLYLKRFRRKYPDLQYIAVLEPQASSAWHWHILCKFTDWEKREHVYIDNNEIIYPMWGHGWTRTQRIDHIDNIGAYLGGYLASVEINDENKDEVFSAVYKSGVEINIEKKEVTDANGIRATKKFVKGGRMHLYPSGTNIYRSSRGIIKPTSETMPYSEAKKIVGLKTPSFSRTIAIIGTTNELEEKLYNTVTYEQYNLKR